MKFEHGDTKLFGTYWSEHGPVRITLEDYVWDKEVDNWVMGRSPRGVEIIKETVKPI